MRIYRRFSQKRSPQAHQYIRLWRKSRLPERNGTKIPPKIKCRFMLGVHCRPELSHGKQLVFEPVVCQRAHSLSNLVEPRIEAMYNASAEDFSTNETRRVAALGLGIHAVPF